jgi:hypothetical protein
MDNREVIFTRWTANGCREEDSIFVVYGCEILHLTFHAAAPAEGRQSEPFPLEEIVGSRQGNSRAGGSEGCVAHDIALELLDKRDSRVLASSAVGTKFILGFRFKGYPKALNADWVAIIVESDTRDPDARKISRRHQPREEVELAVRSARTARIENAACLLSIESASQRVPTTATE